MNAKLLSLLFILFLGIGFSSCSKDKNESSYDSGKNQGVKLREVVSAYKSGNTTEAASNLLLVYQQYKKNSSDKEWKEGFLGGATNFDKSKYSGLENLLDQDFSLTNIADILPSLANLLN